MSPPRPVPPTPSPAARADVRARRWALARLLLLALAPPACGGSGGDGGGFPGPPLPDLVIDRERLAATAFVDTVEIAPDSCALAEGCVGGPGTRTVVRFDLWLGNEGDADLVIGDPAESPVHAFSPCHGHFHLQGFAAYALTSADGTSVVAPGHKQGFCIADFAATGPDAPPRRFTCEDQGLSVGWLDRYDADLDCQWIDVTGVPPGEYRIEARVDVDEALPDSDRSNDVASVAFTLP